MAESLVPGQFQPDVERKADLLASVFQRTFEIPDPPPPAALKAIAPQVATLIRKIAEAKQAMVYGEKR
jgi:hypothetical protein